MTTLLIGTRAQTFISDKAPTPSNTQHRAEPSHLGLSEVWRTEQHGSGEVGCPDDGELDLQFRIAKQTKGVNIH
jgi:hypothetical protein